MRAALALMAVLLGASAAGQDHRAHAPAAPPGAAEFAISSDVPFETLMARAMARMHAGMDAVRFTGRPDQDFLRLMIPHHQGAIDMARIALLHTEDPRIRNLAQSIVTEQQYEIDLMRSLLAPGPAGAASPRHEEERK
jgi:hypothetical protein